MIPKNGGMRYFLQWRATMTLVLLIDNKTNVDVQVLLRGKRAPAAAEEIYPN